MQKKTASWYIKQLDILFSAHVRSRGYCEHCGRTNLVLQCAHVEPRTNFTLRWDDKNALCLCVKCHLYWAHTNPRAFVHWFEEKYPERAKYIDDMRNIISKRTLEDYQKLFNLYKAL